jgi:YHS domain-containing protein
MEEIDRRLKHVAYLVADLDLRIVIPRLTELASMFANAKPPRKEGLCDRVWVDFAPTPAYPVQARLTVGMAPNPSAEMLRVSVSVVLVPVYLPYEREAWIDLRVESPDTKALEEFLDKRLVQFAKDYLRTATPESPYHEHDKVTDPVCQMTFPISEAADSMEYKDHVYYFCVEGCRRKFVTAPERYLPHLTALKDLSPRERSPLLEASPADIPTESALGAPGR